MRKKSMRNRGSQEWRLTHVKVVDVVGSGRVGRGSATPGA